MKFTTPRVLMLGPVPPPLGGMATVLDNLKKSSLSEKCELFIQHTGKSTSPNRKLMQGILSQMRLILKIQSIIRKNNIQIVHIHTCSGFTYWRDCIHMLVARFMGCRTVLHVHGGFFDQFIESLDPIRKKLFHLFFRMPCAVIVLSENWKNTLSGYAPLSWVVGNGIVIPEEGRKMDNDRTTFLFLGNLGKEKGVFDLVEAVSLAKNKGFTGLVKIAGKAAEQGDKNKLTEFIASMDAGEQVCVIGEIIGHKKEDALREADCLVLPSHGEGLPMAILEGMAYALPILATHVGAIPEVVTQGEEGFLFTPKDVESFAAYLVLLDKDCSKRRKMGQKAKDKAIKDFSIEKTTQQLMNIYREIA